MTAPIHAPGEVVILYGTLKPRAKGYPAWLKLAAAGRALGPARFFGRMFDFGKYPGVQLDGDTLCHGELFEVSDPDIWPVLDAYEDVNWCCPEQGEYRRVEIEVLDDFGEQTGLTAWIYEHRMPEWTVGYPVIKSGNWPLAPALPKRRAGPAAETIDFASHRQANEAKD
ncbi:MAG: gamma-glutamylcyclotransferase family protein [Pseudomonadota bacterium]